MCFVVLSCVVLCVLLSQWTRIHEPLSSLLLLIERANPKHNPSPISNTGRMTNSSDCLHEDIRTTKSTTNEKMRLSHASSFQKDHRALKQAECGRSLEAQKQKFRSSTKEVQPQNFRHDSDVCSSQSRNNVGSTSEGSCLLSMKYTNTGSMATIANDVVHVEELASKTPCPEREEYACSTVVHTEDGSATSDPRTSPCLVKQKPSVPQIYTFNGEDFEQKISRNNSVGNEELRIAANGNISPSTVAKRDHKRSVSASLSQHDVLSFAICYVIIIITTTRNTQI